MSALVEENAALPTEALLSRTYHTKMNERSPATNTPKLVFGARLLLVRDFDRRPSFVHATRENTKRVQYPVVCANALPYVQLEGVRERAHPSLVHERPHHSHRKAHHNCKIDRHRISSVLNKRNAEGLLTPIWLDREMAVHGQGSIDVYLATTSGNKSYPLVHSTYKTAPGSN